MSTQPLTIGTLLALLSLAGCQSLPAGSTSAQQSERAATHKAVVTGSNIPQPVNDQGVPVQGGAGRQAVNRTQLDLTGRAPANLGAALNAIDPIVH